MIVITLLTLVIIFTKDLVNAVVLSAAQSIFFVIALYLLLAVDVALVYLPVAVGGYSLIFLYAIGKTERFEKVAGYSRKLIFLSVMAFMLIAALLIGMLAGGYTGWIPREVTRPLARFVLRSTINHLNKTFWTSSPEAVSATVWDYRGLDTFFEIAVFYGSIAGCLALFRFIDVVFKERPIEKADVGLSIVAKASCKIIFALIAVASASLMLHGHLTPGGGFQGGSAFSIALMVVIIPLSQYFLRGLGLEERRLMLLRSIGLTLIALLILLPAALGGYIFQNQAKLWADFGYPTIIGGFWTSGSIFFLNLFDGMAVAAGFAIIFLILSIPEECFKRLMKVKP